MTGLLLAAVLALVGTPAMATTRYFALLTLIGCNDDFNSRASNLLELLAHDPDVIFIQEGKAADYRQLLYPQGHAKAGKRILDRTTWGVHQDTSSAARMGTVIIWRFSAFERTAGGFTYGTHAAGLLVRWIAWLRGTTVVGGRRVFLLSAHWPPVRVKAWWQPYSLAVWARLKLAQLAGRLVLGEADSNQHGGPPVLPRGIRWVGKPGAIDGFLLSKGVVVVDGPTPLPFGSSDHHPYKLRVRIPARRKAAR